MYSIQGFPIENPLCTIKWKCADMRVITWVAISRNYMGCNFAQLHGFQLHAITWVAISRNYMGCHCAQLHGLKLGAIKWVAIAQNWLALETLNVHTWYINI